jgi:hypothetical protein
MANPERGSGLQTIFSFFLGLMVTAFVGVGVYTFHPPDKEPVRQMQELSRREQAIRNAKPAEQLTVDDRAQIQQLTDQRNRIADASQAGFETWARSTSIMLIAFATLAMVVSLVRPDALPVISNGLLLGGVFTMVYGVGWIVAAGASVTRFVVMTAAFVITLALGYVRFVRRRAIAAAAGGAPVTGSEGVAELERRVGELEDRMDGAASALGRRG